MSTKSLTKYLLITATFILLTFFSKAQLSTQFSGTPLSGCAPFSVNFTDLSTGNPIYWKWDLGNSTISFLQNPSTVYLNPGIYSIKLVIKNIAGTMDSLKKVAYINVYAKPVANFTSTPLRGCYPLLVNFTDLSTTSTGVITNWLWDFGDGNTSILSNPTHIYNAAGNYTVSLSVTNSNGCTNFISRSNYISVNNGVKAAFTNSKPVGCTAPQTIDFQNQSTGTGILIYKWEYGDGSTATGFAPSHTYTAAGSYTVKLIVINSTGCVDSFTNPIPIIIGSASADFISPATVCVGNQIFITNTSNPNPVSSLWNFGDATTSVALNPVKTYNTAGNYTITLTSDFGGCQATKSHPITVFAKPTSSFSSTATTSCKPPLTINFTNTTIGATSTKWLFGDGDTSIVANPVHTYLALGTYNVTLITTNANGCRDTLVKTAYVKINAPTTVIDSLPRGGCAPYSWTFSATINSVDPIVAYEWNFGDGTISTQQNPTHIFAVGVYNIQLVITTSTGCKDTVIVPQGIKAVLKPVANFSATPRNACAKNPIQFTDLSTGTVTNWLWDFGDGTTSTDQNPSHPYSDTGLFTITLIVSNNGCKNILVIKDYIHIKPPIAIFSITFKCNEKYKRTFVDQSIGADTWKWDFGDNTTSTAQNPVHIYAAVGTYTVSLTVTNKSTGCDHTQTAVITIADEAAVFNAALTELCKNSSTVFTAISIQANSAIVNYEWNFGDLTGTFFGNNISHSFSQAGLYTVKLIVTDVNGCKDSLTKLNYIRVNGPTANFASAVPGSCLNTFVVFNDFSTTDGTHALTTWYWNYGDGIFDTLSSGPFQHKYGNSGIYNVTLVVKDSYGCKDSTLKSRELVISTPVADYFSADTLSCPSKPVRFQNLSTGPSLTYSWSFGDGGNSTLQDPVHVYTADGQYTVILTITDKYGCTATKSISKYIVVNTAIANFTVSDSFTTCPPLVTQFTNTSKNIKSYLWDFGDGGGTSSVFNPPHTYGEAGLFTAKLTITTFGGCTDVKTKIIEVRGPRGTFTYNPIVGCTPLNVNFSAKTHDRVSFIWDFNDGNVYNTKDSIVAHKYTVPGVYLPKMILTDAAGCNVAINGTDTIKVSGVIAGFSPDTLLLCNDGNISFTNTTASNDIITGYHWFFGDGNTSTDFEPTHYYSSPGNYYPKLVANTKSGCTDTIVSAVPIKVAITPQISSTQSSNGCAPLTMNFAGNLLNADSSPIQWQWAFNNGTVATGQQLPPIVYNNAGQYSFSLTAINSSGCKDTVYNSFEAFEIPVVNAGDDILICQGTGKTISATGIGSVKYAWSPTVGLSCVNCSAPIATPDVQMDYTVTGTSVHGCTNTDVVRVSVKYPFQMLGGNNDTLCVGQSVRLTVSGAATYQWTPTTGLNTITGPVVNAAPSATTTYSVIGTDDKSCFKDTAYFPIKVYPIPTVSAGADRTINVGQTITLTPTFSTEVTKVIWTPTTWLISTNTPSITVRPNVDTKYTVTVYNPGGCKATDDVNIFVVCNGANVFIPNTFSPNGDGINDVFYVRGSGLFTIKQARIFNRWGEEVFGKYSFNPNEVSVGWDGTFKGQKLSTDVYVYMIEIQCDNSSTLLYKGNIALIR